MKSLLVFFPTLVKAVVGVVAFLIGLGWAAFLSVNMIVKAEGREIRAEFHSFRTEDMKHINKRFDETQGLIKEMIKKGK
jgi:hypothetical protein